MAIADELTKLEANRANIVRAINNKGGELAENAGLAACPEAISQLSSAGGTTLWTGHVDEAGLRHIGWDDDDIANLKANICWNEEDDALYAVPQDHKDLWDACEKVVANGRAMLALSAYPALKANYKHIKYLPAIDLTTNKNRSLFDGWVSLVALPGITIAVPQLVALFRNCRNLLYLNNVHLEFNGNSSVSWIDSCYRLKRLPFFDALNLTNLDFSNCCSLDSIPKYDCKNFTTITFKGAKNLKKIELINCAPTDSLAYCLSESNVSNFNISMKNATNIEAFYHYSSISERYFDFTERCISVRANIGDATKLSFADTCSLAGITSANNLLTSAGVQIPKICVDFNLVKEVFEMMLRGIPNYTADSYPMYFESGSTVTDDAAGTLQSLVEQCQAMGWAIYNLTINPYTE